MVEENVKEVIDFIEDLEEDSTVPRNVKIKLDKMIKILSEKVDISIRVNKAQNELEEVSNDSNMQPYTRTQLWQIASMLEKL